MITRQFPARSLIITKKMVPALLIALLLMTADISSATDSGKIVVMPVETADKSMNEAVAVIEEIITSHFKDNPAVTIISTEHKETLAGADTGNRLHIIKNVAAKMASDQVLVFSLLRYRDRVGDSYSVKDPASLAFDFKLINGADGKVTCSSQFDETQESLIENILALPLAFKRGFKWLTVKQLAAEAIPERFATCPSLAANPHQ